MPHLRYPATATVDQVDDFHGTKVADPYRWLEAQAGPDVEGWVAAQNQLTREVLDALPCRSELAARLAELGQVERRGVPVRRGVRRFELRHDGREENESLWIVDDRGERLLMTPQERYALTTFDPSPDGSLVAVGTAEAGSDWTEIRVVDVVTGELLPDRIPWTKFSTASWTDDGAGFVYCAFQPPAEDVILTAANSVQQVRMHRLGQPDDAVLYLTPEGVSYVLATVAAGRLVLELMRSTVPSTVLVGGLDGTDLREVVTGDAVARFVGIIGDEVLVQSHLSAPNGRVVAVGLRDGAVREVVAERAEPLDAAVGSAFLCGGRLVTCRTRVMGSVLTVTDLSGQAYDVALPGEGMVAELQGRPHDEVFAFAFMSATHPNCVLLHSLDDRTTTTLFAPTLPGYDPSDYVIETVHVPSGEVLVPAQVIRRRDVTPDGTRPTLVTGYGGFGVVLAIVGFQQQLVPWLEAGGVYVIAGLRGGGEYGERWHDDGRRERKQNVFDDAIAVATWLVEHGWTSPRQLALTGASNGGLLAGAVLAQRPELFAAVVVEVGVLDMLRYQHFTAAAAWIPEYGCADDPDQFGYLHAYSPTHNIVDGRRYPATLIVTGDHDDRVPPGVHSFKFAAALQAAQGGTAPVLLRVEHNAGHGQGKAMSVQIAERTDVLAFLLDAVAT